MIKRSPDEKSARIKVRRFLSSDIEKIAALDERLSSLALKRTLGNNLNNDFLCCLVLVDMGEVVGVLVARLISDPLADDVRTNEDKRLLIQRAKFYAFDEAFYIRPSHREEELVNMLLDEYKSWAERRGASRVTISNALMTEFKLNSKQSYETYEVR